MVEVVEVSVLSHLVELAVVVQVVILVHNLVVLVQ